VAKLPGCTGKVAVLGYCLGALMVFLTAVRHGVDAAVAYHGGDTEKYLGEIDGLRATVYSYAGQHHAFSRHNGAHYNGVAAALANGRTREFPHQQLR
jgi:carboxymethylenebutenolidase